MTKNLDTNELDARYRAPALEKGLDILELLSESGGPMTATQITKSLDKSMSQIFRMLQVLEHRGYIAASGGNGFELTPKLFVLGLAQTSTQSLITAAIPQMEKLSRAIMQSCHLVVVSNQEIVVVARVESPSDLGFSVRVGYRRSIVEATSGMVLYGLQTSDVQENWHEQLSQEYSQEKLDIFYKNAAAAKDVKYAIAQSDFVQGVTDIAVPIMGQSGPVASLTVPFLKRKSISMTPETAVGVVKEMAQNIEDTLAGT